VPVMSALRRYALFPAGPGPAYTRPTGDLLAGIKMTRSARPILSAACCAAMGAAATLAGSAPPAGAQTQAAPGAPLGIDLELVLAVDVSQSMDYEEHQLQRQGYA